MYNPAFLSRLPQSIWMIPKDQDKNYVAAFFHSVVIMLTSISIAQLSWFRIYSDECAPHLKLNQFFSFDGYFDTNVNAKGFSMGGDDVVSSPVTVSYYSSGGVLYCVSPKIANLMRILILLCFMVLIFSIAGFLMDTMGPSNKTLQLARRNALCSSFTVLWVVVIIGVSYYITSLLTTKTTSLHKQVIVAYDYGCYVITAAGALAVIGTATNLMQVHSPFASEDIQRRHLVDDWDDVESFTVDSQSHDNDVVHATPPPPYTP